MIGIGIDVGIDVRIEVGNVGKNAERDNMCL